MPEQFPDGLTKRQRALIGVVRFRNHPPGSPVYVLPGERGHSDIYVPAMYSETAAGPLHERLWTLQNVTVKAAIDSGAIAIGAAQPSNGLRGIPEGRIVAPLTVGPWREPARPARPGRHRSHGCCGNMHSARCADCPMGAS